MEAPNIIQGGTAEDARGTVSFVNDFDLRDVRRVYRVTNSEAAPFRGWIAHKVERKWFLPAVGRVSILLVPIDDFDHPSPTLPVLRYGLDEASPAVLHVPGGYAIGIRSETPGASVLVFSNSLLGAIPDDVWRWPPETWNIDIEANR